jgi:hypothetical protein
MPESVRDRCTKSHEYIFLLTKSTRYYYNADAIAEPLAAASIARLAQPTIDDQAGSDRIPGKTNGTMKAVKRKPPNNWATSPTYHDADPRYAKRDDVTDDVLERTNRNKRSVWNVPTEGFKEAHFATFPCALIEPCILAGSPRGGAHPRPLRWRRHDRHGGRPAVARCHPDRTESRLCANGNTSHRRRRAAAY